MCLCRKLLQRVNWYTAIDTVAENRSKIAFPIAAWHLSLSLPPSLFPSVSSPFSHCLIYSSQKKRGWVVLSVNISPPLFFPQCSLSSLLPHSLLVNESAIRLWNDPFVVSLWLLTTQEGIIVPTLHGTLLQISSLSSNSFKLSLSTTHPLSMLFSTMAVHISMK